MRSATATAEEVSHQKENADFNMPYCQKQERPHAGGHVPTGHALFTISDKTFDHMVEASNGRTGYHIHVSEGMNGVYDSCRTTAAARCSACRITAFWAKKTILGHCVHVNTAEMDIIRETGTMVVNNPGQHEQRHRRHLPGPLQLYKRGITRHGHRPYTNDMLESLKVALCSPESQNCPPNVGWCEVTDMLFEQRQDRRAVLPRSAGRAEGRRCGGYHRDGL